MPATVFIVDDDAAVRDALTLLIESVGLNERAELLTGLMRFEIHQPAGGDLTSH